MIKINIAARRRARRFALQALYQWYFNPELPEKIAGQFLEQAAMASVDVTFFEELLLGIVNEHLQLDQSMQSTLSQSLSTVQPVELCILRIGVYELKHFPEIPSRVIVNEAIELAKAFGAPGAHKYVNGALHHLANEYRPA